jgi:hypothetical protein
MCPHRQATWAGNRAGPSISDDSESVSPVPIVQQAGQEAVLGRLSLSVCLWWSLFFVHLFFFLQYINPYNHSSPYLNNSIEGAKPRIESGLSYSTPAHYHLTLHPEGIVFSVCRRSISIILYNILNRYL